MKNRNKKYTAKEELNPLTAMQRNELLLELDRFYTQEFIPELFKLYQMIDKKIQQSIEDYHNKDKTTEYTLEDFKLDLTKQNVI